MLANPIVVGVLFPEGVLTVAVAIMAEVLIQLTIIERARGTTGDLHRSLLAMNLMTWPCFFTVDEALRGAALPHPVVVLVLEGVVVGIETLLVILAGRGRFFARVVPGGTISFGLAATVALAGNVVSVVAGIAAQLVL